MCLPIRKTGKTRRKRECVLRALIDGGQTRVWNLMIDLIVQTGRFPTSANDRDAVLEKTGEAECGCTWRFDRFTGRRYSTDNLERVPERVHFDGVAGTDAQLKPIKTRNPEPPPKGLRVFVLCGLFVGT